MILVNYEEGYNNYFNALRSGDVNKIENAKYNLLWECSNLLALVTNYIALEKVGIHFYFGKRTIRKGTKLYRVRSYNPNTDFSNPCEWGTPPSRPQSRANHEGQEALYLGSDEFICLFETNTKENSRYVVATYEVIEDIEVGGFLLNRKDNQLHNLAGMIINAFFIAPSRSEKTKEVFDYFDNYYGKLSLSDFENLKDLISDHKNIAQLPLKFGVLNQRNQYYCMTNQICDILRKTTPDGIKYSSCYIPIDTIMFKLSSYNIALYHSGIKKLKFIDYEIKTSEKNYSGVEALKAILSGVLKNGNNA